MGFITTPIENVAVGGKFFLVKREDKCSNDDTCPPFSKMRGVMEHISELKRKGFKTIGYVETSISMAGWGIAWACKALGLQAVIYDPIYTTVEYKGQEVHKIHRIKWNELGAMVLPVKAGMAKVNYYIGKSHLKKHFKHSIMLPLGLPLLETIQQTSQQFLSTDLQDTKTIVISVGSGTICAGIIKGLKDSKVKPKLYGVLCRESKNKTIKRRLILQKTGIIVGGMLGAPIKFELVDLGYSYTDAEDLQLPFNCNKYYDQKAVRFLLTEYKALEHPILFWNIGGDYKL